MFRFYLKLKRLKLVLRRWNLENLENVFSNIKEAESAVKEAELKFQNSHSDSDLVDLNAKQATLFRFLTEEEIFWKQKAGIKWLKEGDSNTKFFHASLQGKHSQLSIKKNQGLCWCLAALF